jgi:hypothetical protein
MYKLIILILIGSNLFFLKERAVARIAVNNMEEKYLFCDSLQKQTMAMTKELYSRYNYKRKENTRLAEKNWILEQKVRRTNTDYYRKYLAFLNKERVKQYFPLKK